MKLHPGYEWDIFHILTSEDIADVILCFSFVLLLIFFFNLRNTHICVIKKNYTLVWTYKVYLLVGKRFHLTITFICSRHRVISSLYFNMVLTIPGIPGKLLEYFEIFLQGRENSWKTDNFAVYFWKTPGSFWKDFHQFYKQTRTYRSIWLMTVLFVYYANSISVAISVEESIWYRFVFAEREFIVRSWKKKFLPWRTFGKLLEFSYHQSIRITQLFWWRSYLLCFCKGEFNLG